MIRPSAAYNRPNKNGRNAVQQGVNQLVLVCVCTVASRTMLCAQSPSPAKTPAKARKAQTVRVAPKPAPTPRVTALNSLTRKPVNFIAYPEALGRYEHVRHTRVWWRRHFATVVLVGGGYYYFDSGYWFPAWGYDPNYEAYDYDGPIFTYGNLLPDQVIVNVQRALADLGYFSGPITGALTRSTRRAISAYQQDEGLEVNGVVDGPTVYALGLI